MRRVALILFVLFLAAAGAVGWAYFELGRPGPTLAEPAIVTVEPGKRFVDVANELSTRGLLRHPLLLVAWARLTGQDRQIRAGDFSIPSALSPRDLLTRLTSRPDVHRVTIPEGLRVHDVVGLLSGAGFGAEESFYCLLDDPAFLAAEDLPPEGAEGYLFPDTYDLPLATPPERILHTMVARFRSMFTPEMVEKAAKLGLTPNEAVILASLVEEEAKRADERRPIAAVFLNRLKRGMPLQSDPTVLYEREGSDRTITRADLHRPTPYNTYTIPGLPPTPIANPGRAALEAAVDPAPVEHLYFVARGDGSHEFSTTLAEHNAAVARYRRR